MPEEEKTKWLEPMSEEAMRSFVNDFVSGLIYSSVHIFGRNPDNPDEVMNETRMVFMPIALGALSKVSPEDLDDVGIFWEHISKAGPRMINGLPMFLSFHVMSKSDWTRASAAIEEEFKRRDNIEV